MKQAFSAHRLFIEDYNNYKKHVVTALPRASNSLRVHVNVISRSSFSIMRKCWREVPDDRPDFAELASITERLLTCIAGYTELSMDLPEGENGEQTQSGKNE